MKNIEKFGINISGNIRKLSLPFPKTIRKMKKDYIKLTLSSAILMMNKIGFDIKKDQIEDELQDDFFAGAFEFDHPENSLISAELQVLNQKGEYILTELTLINSSCGININSFLEDDKGNLIPATRLTGDSMTEEDLENSLELLLNPIEQSKKLLFDYLDQLSIFERKFSPIYQKLGFYLKEECMLAINRESSLLEFELCHPKLYMTYSFEYSLTKRRLIFHNPASIPGDDIIFVDELLTKEDFEQVFNKAIEPIKNKII